MSGCIEWSGMTGKDAHGNVYKIQDKSRPGDPWFTVYLIPSASSWAGGVVEPMASRDSVRGARDYAERTAAKMGAQQNPRPKKNPLTAGLGSTYIVTHANPRGGSDLGAWTKSTTAQLVKNANFWINTGLSKEDALRKVFGQSSAGPKIQAEVRAQVLGRSNPRPAPSKSVKLRFSSRTDAWDAMHTLDAAGIDAGFPSLGAEQIGPNKGYYTVQVARKNATAARKVLSGGGARTNPRKIPVKPTAFSKIPHASGWHTYRLVQVRSGSRSADKSAIFFAPSNEAAQSYAPQVLFEGARAVRLERAA